MTIATSNKHITDMVKDKKDDTYVQYVCRSTAEIMGAHINQNYELEEAVMYRFDIWICTCTSLGCQSARKGNTPLFC